MPSHTQWKTFCHSVEWQTEYVSLISCAWPNRIEHVKLNNMQNVTWCACGFRAEMNMMEWTPDTKRLFLKDRKEASRCLPLSFQAQKNQRPQTKFRSRSSPVVLSPLSTPHWDLWQRPNKSPLNQRWLSWVSLSDENSSLCSEGKHFLLLCTCARARLLHRRGHCKSPSPLLNLQEQGPKVTREKQWQYFVCVYWLTLHFFKTK